MKKLSTIFGIACILLAFSCTSSPSINEDGTGDGPGIGTGSGGDGEQGGDESGSGSVTPPATADGTLLFKTGFEGTSQVENHTTSQYDHFTGTDNSVTPSLDWLKFKRKQISEYLGGGQLYYEGGSPSIRLASVVTDPTNSSNKVLRFWLKEPNVIRSSDNLLYKSRIQMDIYGAAKGIQDMYQKVRFYMPQSMAALKNYVKPTDSRVTNISWLTIAEFWNNMVHSTFSYEYRLTVGIGKDAGANQPLYFHF